MGFINKFIELAKADGKTVAVVGNDFYVNQVKDNGDQASADVVLEVAVPAQTTVELCAPRRDRREWHFLALLVEVFGMLSGFDTRIY